MSYLAIPIQLELHRDQILALWKQNMSDPRIGELAGRRFAWFYEQSPDTRPFTNLLVHAESNQVVGCGSFYPRRVVVDGQQKVMGVLADFAVDSAHRAAGPAIAIQRSLAESSRAAGVDFLAAYPNRNAEGIFKRVGFRAVGKSTRWVKPLRSRREIAKRVSHIALVGPASRIADLGLAAMDLKLSATQARVVKKLRGGYADSSDARFDALWEQSKGVYRIAGERTASYLNWRYRDFPSLKYRFFALTDPADERVAAYLTFLVNAQNVAVVGDLFCQDPEHTLDALLLRFAAAERAAGRESISVEHLGPETFGGRLKRIGFHFRPTERSMFVYCDPATPEDLKSVVSDKENWFTTEAEMDI